MALINTKEKFGSITKLLHWSIFLLFVTQYFLVYRREFIVDDKALNIKYILLHKSIGIIVLTLAMLMIFWKHLGQRPAYTHKVSKHEMIAAKIMHSLLYLSMLVMPISGIAMTFLGGRTLMFFGYELPTLLAVNKPLSEIMYMIHHYSSYVIIGLVSGHIIAALFHHFIRKDDILNRMRPCGKSCRK